MSRLRDLAEAATPGPWRGGAGASEADAAFVQSCSPEVIVAYENLKDAAADLVDCCRSTRSTYGNDRTPADFAGAELECAVAHSRVDTLTKEEQNGSH